MLILRLITQNEKTLKRVQGDGNVLILLQFLNRRGIMLNLFQHLLANCFTVYGN